MVPTKKNLFLEKSVYFCQRVTQNDMYGKEPGDSGVACKGKDD